VGMRKDDERISQVNKVLATFREEEQFALMDDMIENQPVEEASECETPSFFAQVWNIVFNNWQQLLSGTGMTLLISILGTII
ncbi:glutamine ABC transporter substrate-binding protein, partial [Streptococcus suis]